MASRLARSALGTCRPACSRATSIGPPFLLAPPADLGPRVVAPGAPLLRPALARRALPALSAAAARHSSNLPAEEPRKKAQSIIDALPGSSLLSKTAMLSSAAGLSIYAISNEYYVVNEETIVAFCLLSVWIGLIKYGGPMYKEWAESQNEKIKNILNTARADHTEAVKGRIEDVKQMGGVVDITKGLFEVSKVTPPGCYLAPLWLSPSHRKPSGRSIRSHINPLQETAKLEAQAFELEQQTALAAEAKTVLDSWVRYEGQVKQRQQKELAASVIAKVHKELENPKVLQQILQQSVADVESMSRVRQAPLLPPR